MTYWAAGSAIVGAASKMYSANQTAKAAGGADPYKKWRHPAARALQNLMRDPSSILKDPMYQGSLELGLQGVSRHMAATGFLDSGNMATALMDYGQKSALGWLQNQEQFLAQLAGAINSPANGAAGTYQAGQQMTGAMGQLGSAMAIFGQGAGSGGQGVGLTQDQLGSIPGMGLGNQAGADVWSDRRLKTNIKQKGNTPGGQPWYSFTYVWGEESEGVMADESPAEAVSIGRNGYLLVDYSKIR